MLLLLFIGCVSFITLVILVSIQNKNAINEIDKSQEQKEKLNNHMIVVGEISANTAHEVKNILQILQLRMSNLSRSLDNPSVQTLKQLQSLEKATSRLNKIVLSMNKLSKNTALSENEPHPITEIFNDALDYVHPVLLKNNTKLIFEDNYTSWIVNCHHIQISQVLVNLIKNAAEVTSSFTDENKKWVKIECHDLGSTYQIRIIDGGSGLTPEVQNNIFQPQFTTKMAGTGTGLGLSISKKFIENHNGKLFYDPTHENTCFVIELPKFHKQSVAI